MIKSLFWSLLLFCPAESLALRGEMTEAEAVGRLNPASPAIKAFEAAALPAAAASRAAGLHSNPEFSADRDSLGEGETSLVLEWAPDLSGRRGLRREAAAASALAAGKAAAETRVELRASVSRAFYALLLAQEAYRERREAAARLKALAAVTRAGYGAADYGRLRLEVEFAAAQAEAEAGAAAEDDARCSLSALLGEPGCAVPRAAGSLLPAGEERTGEGPGSPSLARLAAEAGAAEAERKAALRRAFPELAFRGGVKTSAGESGAQAGLSLSLPIFDAGRGEAGVKAAERSAALARLDLERQRLAAGAEGARLRLRRLLAVSTSLASEVVPQAQKLERAAALAYAEGRLGAADLVDAFRTGLRVRLDLLETAHAARLAEIDLRLARGE
ncbi:MAG: TolC family protein [Elusimicrobiota bacterium]